MKYVQLIFSPTGGTKKVADIISSEWSGSVETVDLTDPAVDFSKISLKPEDIVLIAMPSFGGRAPGIAIERLTKIKGNSAKAVLLCVYGNRAYDDTMIEMADTAKNCGFIVAAAVSAIAEHSIAHEYAAGRPDEKDIGELKKIAGSILEKIGDCSADVEVPGNRPYQKFGGAGLIPKASDECIGCGLCAKKCPAQAIDMNDLKNTDPKKCISCMRCVVKCPKSARKASAEITAAITMAIKEPCSVRKECELFI